MIIKSCNICEQSLSINEFNFRKDYNKYRDECQKCRNLLNVFGINRNDFDLLLKKQKGLCAICGNAETARHQNGKLRSLAVDHCHSTGVIRGLLCTNCNTSIGGLKDNYTIISNALDYLKAMGGYKVNLKVKKLSENAAIGYSRDGDAGLDITATSKTWDEKNEVLIFGTDLQVEIPRGHFGALFPRSSVFKTGMSLANSVGIIDQNFRGEIKVLFYPGNRPKQNYEVGDRIAQLVILPYEYVNIQVVDELSDSNRGTGGFGSSGK